MTVPELVGGMGLAGAAAACFEGGYVLQAYEARRAPTDRALRASLFLYLVRRRRWLVAAGLLTLGWPLQVGALRLAPLTVVQPTLSLGLLLLLAFAARWLHERVGLREIAGVLGIAAGTAVIAWGSPDHTDSHGDAVQLALALAPVGALTLAPYLAAVVAHLQGRGGAASAGQLGDAAPAGGARRGSGFLGGWLLLLSAGAADAWSALATKIVSDEIGGGRWGFALAWAVGAGAMFGLGLLSEMTALQRLPATRVGPTVLAMQVGLPVALAPLALAESWSGTPLGGAAIALGLVAVVAGVAIISSSRPVSRLNQGDPGPPDPAAEAELAPPRAG